MAIMATQASAVDSIPKDMREDIRWQQKTHHMQVPCDPGDTDGILHEWLLLVCNLQLSEVWRRTVGAVEPAHDVFSSEGEEHEGLSTGGSSTWLDAGSETQPKEANIVVLDEEELLAVAGGI
jgi:hypothetical protein